MDGLRTLFDKKISGELQRINSEITVKTGRKWSSRSVGTLQSDSISKMTEKSKSVSDFSSMKIKPENTIKYIYNNLYCFRYM
jgi:hypothetical protein